MPKGIYKRHGRNEIRECLICERKYEAQTNWQQFCSRSCANIQLRNSHVLPCKKCGTMRQVGTGKYKAPLCLICERKSRRQDPKKRFMKYVRKTPACWLWTGGKTLGYGKFYHPQSSTRLAPRISWELHRGPIPKGLLILHKCDNPPCVNPSHLEVGDHRKNLIDAYARGLHKTKRRQYAIKS